MDATTRKTWIGKLSNYKEMDGIIVPTSIEAIYRLDKGDYSYARFNLKMIEYNVPKIFSASAGVPIFLKLSSSGGLG